MAPKLTRPSMGAIAPMAPNDRPWPPVDLNLREPSLAQLAPGDVLHRFYPRGKDPIYFDRGTGGRLNAPDRSFGVLYTARNVAGAFAETFLRTPGRQVVDAELVARKAYVQLEVLRPMTVIDLDGPGLAILGATAEVVHGAAPYDLSQAWSGALRAHPVGPAGIAYTARHDPDEECFALFDGAALRVVRRVECLDDNWFWSLADYYQMGRARLRQVLT